MGLKSVYNSTYGATEGGLRFESNSTQNAAFMFSTQVVRHMPIFTGSTSATNPQFGFVTVTSTNGALVYDIGAPIAPYGHELSIFCAAHTSQNTVKVRFSTDASVTVDGTNGAISFTTGGNIVELIAGTSQRWYLKNYSTQVAFSTN
jgi:hypothetical protein